MWPSSSHSKIQLAALYFNIFMSRRGLIPSFRRFDSYVDVKEDTTLENCAFRSVFESNAALYCIIKLNLATGVGSQSF